MAALALAVVAGGVFKAMKTIPLLTIEEGLEALRKASGTRYRPPGHSRRANGSGLATKPSLQGRPPRHECRGFHLCRSLAH
jgi:hypothetical protein